MVAAMLPYSQTKLVYVMVRKSKTNRAVRIPELNRRNALILTVVAVLVLGACLQLLSSYFTSPVQGIISLARVASFRGGIDMTPELSLGEHASFAYPKGFTSMPSGKPIFPVIDSYRFAYSGMQSWNLSVTILRVPGGSLGANNAYQFRKVHPERFVESSAVVNGRMVTIMTDKSANGFSEVGFLVHDSYQAVISLNGGSMQDANDLSAAFAMVVSTWHWS